MRNNWLILLTLLFVAACFTYWFFYKKTNINIPIYEEQPPTFSDLKDEPKSLEVENLRAKEQLEKNKIEKNIAKQERRLDAIEKHHILKQKEENMRDQGILPPKPSNAIGINGKKYPSYVAFKQSREYQDWIALQNAKHYWRDQKVKIDEQYEKGVQRELYQKLNERESKTGALGWIEKRRTANREKVAEYMGHPGPWLKDKAYIPPKDEDDFAREKYDELIRKYDAITKKEVFEPMTQGDD